MIRITATTTKQLLFVACLWASFLNGAALIYALQEWDTDPLSLPAVVSFILMNTTALFALIHSIQKRHTIIQTLSVSLPMSTTFDPSSLCILLLKANLILVPLAVIQFVYKFDVFQGTVQQFAYALFIIELLLTFLLYLWTRIELARQIEAAVKEEEARKI